MIGKIVSTKMNKTVVVVLSRVVTHPVYKKKMKRTKRVKAHNELADVQEGDVVRIESTRPLSREKRYRVVERVDARKQTNKETKKQK